jgi:hypothetical protein
VTNELLDDLWAIRLNLDRLDAGDLVAVVIDGAITKAQMRRVLLEIAGSIFRILVIDTRATDDRPPSGRVPLFNDPFQFSVLPLLVLLGLELPAQCLHRGETAFDVPTQ